MAHILIFLAVALTILQCEGDTMGMKAIYHKGGKAVEGRLSPADQNKTFALLKEVFAGTDDMLRVRVTEELVGRIKTTESALEFVFDAPSEFTSRIHGKYAVTRLLLPLTGDFAGSGNDSVATVFVANDRGFVSGPLRNSQARPLLLKLQDLLSESPSRR